MALWTTTWTPCCKIDVLFDRKLSKMLQQSNDKKSTSQEYDMARVSISIGNHTVSSSISHVLNKPGSGYEYLNSIELTDMKPVTLKSIPKMSKFTKFESYWLKRKGMIRF